MSPPVGVVVMAYGTPTDPAMIEAYYTHIRRGRPPTAEQLANLTARYQAIGGVSPLAARTEAQRAAIAAALEARHPGRFTVVLGLKHAAPFIEDGVNELASSGVQRIVGVVLAPHFSAASVGEYLARARETASGLGLGFAGVESWWDLEPVVAHHATSVSEHLRSMPAHTKVLFTAHSLPERVLAGDRYPQELASSADAIASLAGLTRWAGYAMAWQSAGATPEPWRGPDIGAVLVELAGTGRCEGVLVCAHGFTTDHLEVRFDLDIEARRVAESHGLRFERTATIDAAPEVMAALAARVAEVDLETPR